MKKIVYNWEILAATRFLLAIIVLLEHMPTTLYKIKGPSYLTRLGAFEAVLGFLIISGLSIGKSIQKNQDSYFKRRIQRIYPIYLVSIIIHFLVVMTDITPYFIMILFFNLIFLNNIFTTFSYIVAAWSLSLEVWLYALAPYLYKLSYKTLLIIIYISFGAFLFYTTGRTLFHWPYYAGLTGGLNLPIFAFIWITGFVYSNYPEKYKFIRLNVLGLFAIYITLTVGIEILHQIKHHEIGTYISKDLPSDISKSSLLLIVYFVVFYNHYITKLPRTVKIIFTILGNISYPLYLTHRSIFILLNKLGVENIPLAIGTTLLVAYLVYYLFDFYTKKREEKAAVATIS